VKQDDLSGTAEPLAPPAEVELIFGRRIDLANRYIEHLATTGVDHGLIGPREVPRIWTRHVVNCALLADVIPQGSEVIDVGSGAGLPGLVLAIRRPDLRVTLIEPLLRRVAWLSRVSDDLGLGSVRVLRARAPQVDKSTRGPVVVARAVASLPTLAGWCLPLVTAGGSLLAIKGRTAAAELAKMEGVFPPGVIRSAEVLTLGTDLPHLPTTVVRLVRGDGPVPGRRRR
jgi:16S rRNA (guanine527-N7)-methyltransferase